MKYCILILFLLTSSWANATTNLVIEVRGTIVQQVPQKLAGANVRAPLRIETASQQFFGVYPDAQAVISSWLSNPKYLVFFYADQNDVTAREVVAKLFPNSVRTRSFVDAEKVLTFKDETIFISTGAEEIQADNIRNLVPIQAYFYYSSFALAQVDQQRLGEEANPSIPSDEHTWNQSYYRWKTIRTLVTQPFPKAPPPPIELKVTPSEEHKLESEEPEHVTRSEGYVPQTSFDFLNPAPAERDGVHCPRTNAPLYRGVSSGHPQYGFARALRALLGDPRAVIPSKLFSKTIGESGAGLSEDAAVRKSIKLGDQYFRTLSDEDQQNFYIKTRSGFYRDYPAEAIFTTIYSGIAHVYGNMVYSLHDYFHRSVDLNFAMDGAAGQMGAQVDIGEFLFPLVIAADELDGFTLFDSTQNEAFFMVKEEGVRYVLVFKDEPCLMKEHNHIYRCKELAYDQYKVYQPLEKPVDLAIPVAVIRMCPENAACGVKKTIFDRHHVKNGGFKSEFQGAGLSGVVRNGEHAEIFYKPMPTDAPK